MTYYSISSGSSIYCETTSSTFVLILSGLFLPFALSIGANFLLGLSPSEGLFGDRRLGMLLLEDFKVFGLVLNVDLLVSAAYPTFFQLKNWLGYLAFKSLTIAKPRLGVKGD
jgi:hypothetical protein